MRCSKLISLAFVAALILPSAAQAQTNCASPCTLKPSQAYSLVFDANGTDTTAYQLYVNGAKSGNPIPVASLVNGSVTIASTAPSTEGTYTLQVTALNVGVPPTTTTAESAKSTAITLISKLAIPATPANVRIILAVSQLDGLMKFEFMGMDSGPGTPVIPVQVGQ